MKAFSQPDRSFSLDPAGPGPVLLIDDDDDAILLIQLLLKRAGITSPVNITTDGEKAVAYFEAWIREGTRPRCCARGPLLFRHGIPPRRLEKERGVVSVSRVRFQVTVTDNDDEQPDASDEPPNAVPRVQLPRLPEPLSIGHVCSPIHGKPARLSLRPVCPPG